MTKSCIELICGAPTTVVGRPVSDIENILSHLAESLETILSELQSLSGTSDKKLLLLAPFLARSWLEVAFTALIGRLDPFRLLTIQRMQLSSGYDRTLPWKCAIRWQGDVVAQKVKELWSPVVDPKEISRALFSDYYDFLLWRPALQQLSDSTPLIVESRWLSELMSISVESFCARKREAVNSIYSELSKAVHFESVTPAAAIADRITIIELVQRCIRETSEVAMLSHFVGHAFANISNSEAIASFKLLEEMEVVE